MAELLPDTPQSSDLPTDHPQQTKPCTSGLPESCLTYEEKYSKYADLSARSVFYSKAKRRRTKYFSLQPLTHRESISSFPVVFEWRFAFAGLYRRTQTRSTPFQGISYPFDYRTQCILESAMPLESQNVEGIPILALCRYVVIIRMHFGIAWRRDLVLHLRSMMAEASDAGMHMFLLYEVCCLLETSGHID